MEELMDGDGDGDGDGICDMDNLGIPCPHCYARLRLAAEAYRITPPT